MAPTSATPSTFDAAAEALVLNWLGPAASDAVRTTQALAWLDRVATTERARLAHLSDALSAVRASITHHLSGGRLAEPGQDGAREGCHRAQALQLAAEARSVDEPDSPVAREPEVHLRRMLHHAQRVQEPWPAGERLWFEIPLIELLMRTQQTDEALERAKALLDLSFPPALQDLCRANVLATVSSLLITLGDMDSALECLEDLLSERERAGRPALGLTYNALLARGMREDFDGAMHHIQAHAWLREGRWPTERWGLTTLIHWIRAQAGDSGPAPLLHPSPGLSPVQANEAWMHAELVLRRGEPALAAQMVQAQLDLHERSGQPPTHVNGMHLMRVLSDAQMAMNQPAEAIASLRASHAFAYSWGLRAAGVRLRMLERMRPTRNPSAGPAAGPSASDVHRHLAHVSHELRNPIGAAIGLLDLLADSGLRDDQLRRLGLARHAVRSALALCDDLVTLGRLDAGAFEWRPVATDVAAQAQRVIAMLQPPGLSAQVGLHLDCEDGLPARLELDPVRLEQLLLNLTGNALKFTRKGAVRLMLKWLPGLAIDQGRLRVEVHDTGPGISPEEMSQLFEEFRQTETGRTFRGQGSGLGLALCGRLVRFQGGEIGADSSAGQGSVFWFELPCAIAP